MAAGSICADRGVNHFDDPADVLLDFGFGRVKGWCVGCDGGGALLVVLPLLLL